MPTRDPRDRQDDPLALRRSIERAIVRDDPRGQILAMLERLQRVAREGTDERRFAERRLAELVLESAPWRAAVLVRRRLRDDANDDACWALMGLAQALLGHHRFAAASYRRALALDPGNPWYSHNLGHILDVALDRPRDALPHLRRSAVAIADEPAIACSLAHALFRCGDLLAARRALADGAAVGGARDPDVLALTAEIERLELRERRENGKRPERRRADAALAAEHRALVRRAARPLELGPSRVARALQLIGDFLRVAKVAPSADPRERALLAGAAALAIARVDGRRSPPIDEIARVLEVPAAPLRARARQLVDTLTIVVADTRYCLRARGSRASS
jgi:tetratricopeptide (TPR) repeat protein